MTRLEELSSKVADIKEPKKSFILSLLKDFCWLETQIDDLRKYPRYIINEKNPKQQAKLPVHDMIKDYQSQKDDIATKILKCLEVDDIGESALLSALKRFE